MRPNRLPPPRPDECYVIRGLSFNIPLPELFRCKRLVPLQERVLWDSHAIPARWKQFRHRVPMREGSPLIRRVTVPGIRPATVPGTRRATVPGTRQAVRRRGQSGSEHSVLASQNTF